MDHIDVHDLPEEDASLIAAFVEFLRRRKQEHAVRDAQAEERETGEGEVVRQRGHGRAVSRPDRLRTARRSGTARAPRSPGPASPPAPPPPATAYRLLAAPWPAWLRPERLDLGRIVRLNVEDNRGLLDTTLRLGCDLWCARARRHQARGPQPTAARGPVRSPQRRPVGRGGMANSAGCR